MGDANGAPERLAHRKLHVTDVLANALNQGGDRPLIRLADGTSLTVSDVRDETSRFVQALASLGVARGSRVGLLSPNRPEVLHVSHSVQLSGALYMALHPMGGLRDHLHVLRDADVDLLIFDAAAYGDRAAEIAAELPGLKLAAFGPSNLATDLCAAAAACAPQKLVPPAIDPDDVVRLAYSGGTTGKPKSIPSTQRVSMECLRIMMAEWEWPVPPRVLSCAPLSHAGAAMTLPTLLKGGTLLVLPQFEPVAVMEAIQEHRINCTMMVPTMIYALLDHPRFGEFDLSSLETVFYGASAISPARLKEAIERIGPVFFQFYGQAECPQTICLLRKADHDPDDLQRLASCGRPVPWLDVELLDDDCNPVPDGEPGEICVRGPLVMDGYRDNDALNEATFRGDWLHTGDVAVRDPGGFLRIVDRKKDMIVTGGFNVYPREVEDVLTAHPAVAAAAVVGLPDEKWGEAVTAFVVPRQGEPIDADALIALVREQKGRFQAPKAVHVIDAIPVTPVGKPDKKALRARFAPATA
ncbi:AMP-binding protein [Stakelama tenebrarum]|uniref:3-methylmercaptopropionyl-CoA ligase n=1 Tax=Stakelama tenebrarum TaxID=2711215 RepID=A0A6G6Y808_9SPHN|nr:AMP-binding protein [Sphingosinithalassobacter tenebrarum]QIG80981.1 AMP-binding protein [Sphingosinithalassobacter tenebrarum]